MNEIKETIIAAQNGDKDSMYKIITKFDPIICKYTRMMRYDEDFKSDMVLHLIKTINDLDLTKFRIYNDYAIINYIRNTLYHQYILLSKYDVRRRNREIYFDKEDQMKWDGEDDTAKEDINNMLLEITIKKVLTEREYTCVFLMVIDGMSSKEVATILGISRQTVNENKNRGLRKLKAVLCN